MPGGAELATNRNETPQIRHNTRRAATSIDELRSNQRPGGTRRDREFILGGEWLKCQALL